MSETFSSSKTSMIDLDSFDTSNVVNMSSMFNGCTNINKLNLRNFDTSKVTNMSSMFSGATSLEEVNLDGFDLTSSTNESSIIGRMFYGASNIKKVSMKNWKIPETFTNAIGCRVSNLCSENLEYIDVTNWNLSRAKKITGLFGSSYANEIKGLETWDTTNIEDMINMFYEAKNVKSLDLSSFNTENVTDMWGMFYNCTSLKTILVSNKFKVEQVSSSNLMFSNAISLVGGNGTTYDSNHTDKEYARIDTSSSKGYFTGK